MIAPIYILAEPIIYFKNIHNFICIFFIMHDHIYHAVVAFHSIRLSIGFQICIIHFIRHFCYCSVIFILELPVCPKICFHFAVQPALHLLPCFIIHIVKYVHAVNPPWQITDVLKFCFWWFSALLHPFHYLCQFSHLLLSRIIVYFFFNFSLFSLDLIAKYPIEICP